MELIVVRLADMKRVHPNQITARCASCGEQVGVYPSGQRVMQQHLDIKLMCSVCRGPSMFSVLAPGAEFEPFQSVDNPERKK